MSLQQIPGLYVAVTEKKGRGMFCANDIEAGALIEICPLIKIPSEQMTDLDKTVLYNYYFLLDESENPACIALGYGSIYNHSEQPNAEVLMDSDASTMFVECTEAIPSGSEILINYIGNIKDKEQLWFTPY